MEAGINAAPVFAKLNMFPFAAYVLLYIEAEYFILNLSSKI